MAAGAHAPATRRSVYGTSTAVPFCTRSSAQRRPCAPGNSRTCSESEGRRGQARAGAHATIVGGSVCPMWLAWVCCGNGRSSRARARQGGARRDVPFFLDPALRSTRGCPRVPDRRQSMEISSSPVSCPPQQAGPTLPHAQQPAWRLTRPACALRVLAMWCSVAMEPSSSGGLRPLGYPSSSTPAQHGTA